MRAYADDESDIDSPISNRLGITMFGDERMSAAMTDTRPKAPGALTPVFSSYAGLYR